MSSFLYMQETSITAIISMTIPTISWLVIIVLLQRTLDVKLPSVTLCIACPLLSAVFMSLQQLFMILTYYNAVCPSTAVELLFFTDAIVQIFTTISVVTLLLLQVQNIWNKHPMPFVYIITFYVILFTALIFTVIAFEKQYALMLLQLYNVMVVLTFLCVQLHEYSVLSGKRISRQINFFKNKQRFSFNDQHLYRIPRSSLATCNIPKSYTVESSLQFPNSNIYGGNRQNMFPRIQSNTLAIFMLTVLLVILEGLEIYFYSNLSAMLYAAQSKIDIYLMYKPGTVDYIYAYGDAQKVFYIIDFLPVYVPSALNMLVIALLMIYQTIYKKPTIESVFTCKALFYIFSQWLYKNYQHYLLAFLQDTNLLKAQFTFDQTTANILFLKYQDLVQTGYLSITRQALNYLDKNLSSVTEETAFYDRNYIYENDILDSNDEQGKQIYENEFREKQRKVLNRIFYATELEASIQLCRLAHVFLKKDDNNYLNFLFNYNTKFEQFKEIIFGKRMKYKAIYQQNSTVHARDVLKIYNNEIASRVLEIQDYIYMYQPIIDASARFLPYEFDYSTDGNILDFLQDHNGVVESKSLQYYFYQHSGTPPHVLVYAKHSVVSRHIIAMQAVLKLFGNLQDSVLLPNELRKQLFTTLNESIFIDNVQIEECGDSTNHSVSVKDADPTILFNEPQFVDFDVDVNNAAEAKDDLLDESNSFEEFISQTSFKNSQMQSVHESVTQYSDTWMYLRDKYRQYFGKKVFDYMNVLFSDNYPEKIRTPLFVQEVEMNGTLYQFDMRGNCKLSLLQDTLYNVLLHINDVLRGVSQPHVIITKEYDVERFTEYIKDQLFKTSFDAEYAELLSKGHCALTVTFLAIKYLELDMLLKIPDTALFACIYELEAGYTPTIYHNRMHIADFAYMVLLETLSVRQAYRSFYLQKQQQKLGVSKLYSASIGSQLSLAQYQRVSSASGTSSSQTVLDDVSVLSATDVFSIIMAACCHDYGHTGVDNPFCVTTQNELAQIYLDTGPMEASHASLSWGYVLSKFSPIFINFTQKQFREFRIKFVELVLATDMTFHFPFVGKIQKIQTNYILDYFQRFTTRRTNYRDQVFKWFIMKCIIKFGDLANPTRSFPVAEFWAFNYIYEYRVIGDIYRRLGITNIYNAQRRENDFVENSQIGFVNFVLKPFIKEICRLTQPAMSLVDGQCLYDKLHENMFNTVELWLERNERKNY